MAVKTSRNRPRDPLERIGVGQPHDGDTLFAIIIEQEIGTVVAGGKDHPEVVAFRMIAMHGEPGTYRFPREDGTTCTVTVSHGDTDGTGGTDA